MFVKKSEEAIEMRLDQIEEFASVSKGIPEEQLKAFMAEVQAWEKDRTQSNPFRGSADGT